MQQPRPASITLIRHGESKANLYKPKSVDAVPAELRGTPNHRIPLTERGKEQAQGTGRALGDRYPDGFDYLYFSPFQRTRQTAEGLLLGFSDAMRRRLETRLFRDILLREQDFGYADPMAALDETAAHFNKAMRRFAAHRGNAGKFYTMPDNGDSWADVCQRTYMFLGKLFQPNRAGANILIVSHAVTIATFAFHLERLTEDGVVELYTQNEIQNCAVGRYEHRAGHRPPWVRVHWNEVIHGLSV